VSVDQLLICPAIVAYWDSGKASPSRSKESIEIFEQFGGTLLMMTDVHGVDSMS
jgi:hypothetical protein